VEHLAELQRVALTLRLQQHTAKAASMTQPPGVMIAAATLLVWLTAGDCTTQHKPSNGQ
jgi:hypothetical protein